MKHFGILLLILCAIPYGSAQTYQEFYVFGQNLGKLDYTLTQDEVLRPCGNKNYYENLVTYKNFAYVPLVGASVSIPGSTYTAAFPTSDTCNKSYTGPAVTYSGNGFTIAVVPNSPGGIKPTIIVPGYINPKYIVVSIMYAPPGGEVSGGIAKGNVSYASSNLVSSTITSKTSFGSSYTEGAVLMTSGSSIVGWANGGQTSSASSSYTNSTTTTDSTAVTVQKTSGTTLGVNGPTCPYCGVDHDYDLIGVWVNPVQLFTLTNDGVVQPNGYGYSTLDQPGLDVYWVYAGELNGDLPVRSSTTTEFARAWAAAEIFPSGQGPALTAQDEQNILQLDPYWNCTYKSPWTDGETSPCAKPPDSTRFTESGGDQSFSYTQPDVGASPTYQTYYFSYTDTDAQGIDVVLSNSQTFGTESKYSASIFGVGFSYAVSNSSTIKHSYETSSQFKSSNTTTATATIWQPPCNVVGDACSPAYPPSNAYNPVSCTAIPSLGQAFGQGYTMYVYQDNLFGTFMIEPYGP